ncbi:tsa family protein, putative [Ichthyophthirius multifiliis]|uniref:thioredoxin-dependent peroxiredoxin n=1 Tax=Ichthyophthirius multifiliis TaxID=5932 RepID=G0QY64_ICHMU|nr:tsa family protein, putative [Ichthyophthirius multifiliis]EGR29838.1 tsa family protein, putative [Ichthyophthirius multifiliis]|eukprot:XP_004031074.1 tsa family protein, putative [Ichthyophthirius multifiliis]
MNKSNFFIFLSILLIQIQTSTIAKYEYIPRVTLPRQKAPYFSAMAVTPEGKFEVRSLDQYEGQYLIIVFYPFDFTYVCPTELVAFSDAVDQFMAIGAKIIAISTDSHFTHLAWTKTPRNQGGVGKLNIPLLADISKRISKAYGVLVEDEMDELYGAALRGLFIIDGKRTIRTVQINDAPVGRSVEETLRLIKAFQHTDKFGDVCPAGWQPGDSTIVPDQNQKVEYFQKVEENKNKSAKGDL